MTTYRIRIEGADGALGWYWATYGRDGADLLAEGEADSIEQASAEARTALLVAVRQGVTS